MKSLPTVCLLFATAGLLAAQQFTISTVVGIPQLPGLFPLVNPTPAVAAASNTAPAIGPATGGAQLYNPSVVFVDSKNNIYIANSYTYVVDMVQASTGILSMIGGDGTPGTAGDDEAATSANITDVHGIAVDSSGNIYISDTSSCRIRRIDNPATNTNLAKNTFPNISTFVGQSSFNNTASVPYCGVGSTSPFTSPGALVFDSKGNLYVTDRGSNTVRVVSSTGAVSTFAGTIGSYGYSGDGGPASKALLAYPVSLTFDAAGNLYIGDEGNSNIRKVDTSGNITTVATGITPQSLGVDAAGNLYFVDGVSSAVKKILPGGGVVVVAGSGLAGYAGDGTFNGTIYTGSQASQAQLNQPEGLAFGPDGSIYVADTNNDIIRRLVVVPSSLGVQDAASDVPGSNLLPGNISPGEILTLFGSGLGPSTLTEFKLGTNGLFPTQLAGTSVTFNGTPAPMIYTSSGLVAVVAPYEIAGSGTANIVLTYQGSTFTASMPVATTTPALFTANTTGTGPAAALNQNSTVNSAANPAHLGSTIVLFATGAGYTTNAADGQPAPTTCGIACLPTPLGTVTVKIGNQFVTPSYAGGAPSLVAGVMQVNAPIPTTIIPGAVLVEVLVNGYPTQPGVTIAVTQ
jgi:trimeric autotransporter adhesin